MRFPGFEGEWEEKKLGEIATNKSKKYNPQNDSSFVKCVELEHLTVDTGELLGFTDGSKSGSIKNVFQKGDVLFGKLRPYLKKYHQPNFDGVCSSEIWVLSGKEISNEFLYCLVQTNLFIDLANQSSGSKMPRADWNILENGLFSFPCAREQQKIASFFSIIDFRIHTQSKIIEKYESLINVLKDALFSQKIRFPNSEGEWATYRVSDFLDFFSTNSLSWEQLEYGTDNLYNLHYGLIHQCNSSQINLTEHILPSIKAEFIPNNYSLCQDGDIAFADASEDTNDVAKSVEFFTCSNKKIVCGLHTIHGRDKLNITIPGFKGYAFSSKLFHHQVRRLAQGTKVFSISLKTFDNIYIDIPSKKEQSKIANFLSLIEQKIAKEKQLLDNYNDQKRFFLKNMFI